MVWAAPGGQPDCSPEPQLEVASRVLAGAGAAGRERWRAGEERWMEGMSQSAARRQLRKPPVFTFLLKEIVGLALGALEPGRSHASTGSFIIHN